MHVFVKYFMNFLKDVTRHCFSGRPRTKFGVTSFCNINVRCLETAEFRRSLSSSLHLSECNRSFRRR